MNSDTPGTATSPVPHMKSAVPDALMAELVRVVQETMQPESVSVWLLAEAQRRGSQ